MKNSKIILPAIVLVLAVGYLLFKNITASVFLRSQDKINLVFYGENARLFSLDSKDVNYAINFPADAAVLVPGGYGQYRVGALSKLVDLEDKPELFRRAFSTAAGAFVDLYFYPPETKIFYEEKKEAGYGPSFREIFFSKSNANLVDRLFSFLNLTAQSKQTYKFIDPLERTQGVFYKKTYRKEALNVQIIYTKIYETATLISNLLDGEGIRVVDLSREEKPVTGCELITKKDRFNSQTVSGLQKFFNCRIVEGKAAFSDIILKLGRLEEDWQAN